MGGGGWRIKAPGHGASGPEYGQRMREPVFGAGDVSSDNDGEIYALLFKEVLVGGGRETRHPVPCP